MIFITVKHISPSNSSNAAKSHSHFSDAKTQWYVIEVVSCLNFMMVFVVLLWIDAEIQWNELLKNHHELQKCIMYCMCELLTFTYWPSKYPLFSSLESCKDTVHIHPFSQQHFVSLLNLHSFLGLAHSSCRCLLIDKVFCLVCERGRERASANTYIDISGKLQCSLTTHWIFRDRLDAHRRL